MTYEYRDEPTVKLTGRSPEELEKKIEELEIKNYGRILSKSFNPNKKNKRRKIYSVKDKCFVYKDTGEKVAL